MDEFPERPDQEPTDSIERFMRGMFTQLITAVARSQRGDLTVNEIAALHLIDRESSMSIGALAASLDLSLPQASRLAARLVDRRFAERREDPHDRRSKILTLAADGQEFVDRVSRERVGEALAAAMGMPGRAQEVVFDAIADLVAHERSTHQEIPVDQHERN